MNNQSNVAQPTEDLNVASDAVSIYEGGNLRTVTIEELVDNDVALRQLINDFNLTKRENENIKKRIETLNLERAGYVLQPWILTFVAAMNILGVAIVGLATNYVTSNTPPPAAMLLLILGIIISVFSAVAPILLPIIIAKYSRSQNNAE